MRPDRLVFSLPSALALAAVVLVCAHASTAQTATMPAGTCKVNTPEGLKVETSATPGVTTGIRIVVKGPDGKPVQRKRFYLLARSANAAGIATASAPNRAEFLQGASPQLREWLPPPRRGSLFFPQGEAQDARPPQTPP